MAQGQTILDRKETIFSLLKIYSERNIQGLQAADELKTLLMIIETHHSSIKDVENYIGSDDFKEIHSLIDTLKVKLIKLITNL